MSKQNIILAVLAAVFVLFIVIVGGSKNTAAPVLTETETIAENKPEVTETTGEIKAVVTAVVTTNKGVITLELSSKESPKTVANFVKLANEGFYNGTRFHRVIKGFMIQGGDPNSKDVSKKDLWGTGGPGYKFADEIDATSELYKTGYKRGVLAMANSGPNTNGSQFFIMHEDYQLPPNYAIFGKVTSGLNVVDAIANVETTLKGVRDLPVEDMIVEKIEIK